MKSDKVDEHLSPICDTAFLIAGMRHIDYIKPGVCEDKYAGILAGEQGIEYARQVTATSPTHYSLSFAGNRTRHIDIHTKQFCEENFIKQILILAAGLDSRAYRLEISSHPTFYEVDTEPIIEYKTKKMEEHGIKPINGLVSIAHDLRNPGLPEKLVANGFKPTLKTFVIIEGLLEYLPKSACIDLLKMTADLMPSGSFVMCTTPCEDMTQTRSEIFKDMVDSIVANNARPFFSSDDVEFDLLKPAGFELVKLSHTLEPDYFYKADMSDPLVKRYYEVNIAKFLETGEGTRQQFYIGRKL